MKNCKLCNRSLRRVLKRLNVITLRYARCHRWKKRKRQLTVEESTLIGQLLCCYRMAVIASVLKRRGRYFVFSEDELTALMGKYGANAG